MSCIPTLILKQINKKKEKTNEYAERAVGVKLPLTAV